MTHLVQILPSDLVEEAGDSFRSLLEGRAGKLPLSDAYFSRDWSALWAELAALGWLEMAQDESFSDLDLAWLVEIWGRFVLPLPFAGTLAAQRDAAGTAFDPTAGVSLLLATQSGGLIPQGEAAALVLTRAGLQARAQIAVTGLDDFAASCPVSLAAEAQGAVSSRLLAVLLAAEALGAASQALALTLDYVKQRVQFERPVATFQAVKHILAGAHVKLEQARSAVTAMCATKEPRADLLAMTFEWLLRIAEDCVQAHGGIGYTWEAAPHRYYRHILALHRCATAALPPSPN